MVAHSLRVYTMHVAELRGWKQALLLCPVTRKEATFVEEVWEMQVDYYIFLSLAASPSDYTDPFSISQFDVFRSSC